MNIDRSLKYPSNCGSGSEAKILNYLYYLYGMPKRLDLVNRRRFRFQQNDSE